ncbi:MFS transporter [Sphaerisporangium dianthi]|uniref:MFS transporter n=1 Tax=Sphaerisporangium dianthi TaxID=1436120 RepID=A0ABV9CVW9_9ACTN
MYEKTRLEAKAPSSAGVLAVIAVAQGMVSLDISVVNVALPTIRTSLGFDVLGLSWVVNAYALTFGGLLLLGGRTADRFGRRFILQTALILFGAMSLLGGLAQSPGQLIAARAAQGVAAALLAPAALAVLTTSFPTGAPRARALGLYSAVTAGGAAVGVLVGGLLTEYAGWRWVMLLNVPLAALGLILGYRHVASSGARDTTRKLDVVGAVLATAGMVLLVFGLIRTTEVSWGSAQTIGTLAASAALLAAFVLFESRYAKEPLVRLGLLANRAVAGANLCMMLISAVMFTSFYFVSLYLQEVLGLAAAPAGLAFLPFSFGLITGSLAAGSIVRRIGARRLLVAGALLAAAGLFWLSMLDAHGGFWTDVLGPTVVAAIGLGPCLVPLAGSATVGVAPNEAGMASGVFNSARQIGGSIGLAALTTVAATRTAGLISGTPAERLTTGYGTVFTVNAALLVVVALLALLLLPGGRHAAAAAAEAKAREPRAGDAERPAVRPRPATDSPAGPAGG